MTRLGRVPSSERPLFSAPVLSNLGASRNIVKNIWRGMRPRYSLAFSPVILTTLIAVWILGRVDTGADGKVDVNDLDGSDAGWTIVLCGDDQ